MSTSLMLGCIWLNQIRQKKSLASVKDMASKEAMIRKKKGNTVFVDK